MNDFIALVMECACDLFGGNDGCFSAACFSTAFCKLAGTSPLDGRVVRAILTGRPDVEVMGDGQYRVLKAAAQPTRAASMDGPARPPQTTGSREDHMLGLRELLDAGVCAKVFRAHQVAALRWALAELQERHAPQSEVDAPLFETPGEIEARAEHHAARGNAAAAEYLRGFADGIRRAAASTARTRGFAAGIVEGMRRLAADEKRHPLASDPQQPEAPAPGRKRVTLIARVDVDELKPKASALGLRNAARVLFLTRAYKYELDLDVSPERSAEPVAVDGRPVGAIQPDMQRELNAWKRLTLAKVDAEPGLGNAEEQAEAEEALRSLGLDPDTGKRINGEARR